MSMYNVLMKVKFIWEPKKASKNEKPGVN